MEPSSTSSPRPEARVLSPEKGWKIFLATMQFCLCCWKFLFLFFILTKELYLPYFMRSFIPLYCFKNTWSRTFIFPYSIFFLSWGTCALSRCSVAMWSFSLSFGKFIISTHWWFNNFNYLYTTKMFEMDELPSMGWVGMWENYSIKREETWDPKQILTPYFLPKSLCFFPMKEERNNR